MDAQRWRADYFSGLVREDVLEFSRLQEVSTMRVFAELLRSRVGSPLSLASMARDLAVSPTTLSKYLDILQALFIVFVVRPWHRNIARATLQSPKVYFYDTGLVQGDDGLRFENLVACHLLKHAHWQQDTLGLPTELHYIRTKDDAEVDFALSDGTTLTHLVECKLSDTKPHRALQRFAAEWPAATAVQVVRECPVESDIGPIHIRDAAPWLMGLDA
jgi:predicted AAA+ superfamily ATPase